MNQFFDKRIMIAGGTGSWGHELTKQLLFKNPKEVRIYSRGEFAQVNMERDFSDKKLKFIIGDVRDLEALKDATKKVDYVFFLSAIKHVPKCEEFPMEAIKTNILGIDNIIQASIINKVKIVIDASSDKGCSPNNLYGMTKAVGEKLIIHASRIPNIETKFICIRAGNAMGSNGSVIPLFINQIKTKNIITITHKEMTRFFLALPEVVNLLLKAIDSNLNGSLFVTNMPACKIIDLAAVLIEHYGNKDTKIIEIGIRQGEKLHECLISEDESPYSYIYDKNYYVYFADGRKTRLKPFPYSKFSSNTKLLNKAEVKEMLAEGGFLK